MADQNYDWISYKLADGVATITSTRRNLAMR